MLTFALFAMLVATAPQDLPAPLSPANLPPPVIVEPVRGPFGDGVYLDLWTGGGQGSVDSCRAKALAAVAKSEGFCFAEINELGQVVGYSRAYRVVVHIGLGDDGPRIFVAVASRQPSKGTSGTIFNRISLTEPVPKSTGSVGKRDLDLEAKLLPLSIHQETLPDDDLAKGYVPAATVLYTKRGHKPHLMSPISAVHFDKADKIPAAIRHVDKRLYKPFKHHVDWMLLAGMEKEGMDDKIKQVTCLGGVQNQSDKTFVFTYITTGNAADHGRVMDDPKVIGAAVRKFLFE